MRRDDVTASNLARLLMEHGEEGEKRFLTNYPSSWPCRRVYGASCPKRAQFNVPNLSVSKTSVPGTPLCLNVQMMIKLPHSDKQPLSG